jgi:low affinity Fe/Cu permease
MPEETPEQPKLPLFVRFSKATAAATGRPITFISAVLIIIVWAVTGPIFNFSDTWQLVINTGTTIITFLMVFLIQNTQNRDSVAIQLKLDELISAVKDARNELINVEELDDETIQQKRDEMTQLAAKAKEKVDDLEDRMEDLEEETSALGEETSELKESTAS